MSGCWLVRMMPLLGRSRSTTNATTALSAMASTTALIVLRRTLPVVANHSDAEDRADDKEPDDGRRHAGVQPGCPAQLVEVDRLIERLDEDRDHRTLAEPARQILGDRPHLIVNLWIRRAFHRTTNTPQQRHSRPVASGERRRLSWPWLRKRPHRCASAHVDVGDLDCVVSVAEPVPGRDVGLHIAGRVGCSRAKGVSQDGCRERARAAPRSRVPPRRRRGRR